MSTMLSPNQLSERHKTSPIGRGHRRDSVPMITGTTATSRLRQRPVSDAVFEYVNPDTDPTQLDPTHLPRINAPQAQGLVDAEPPADDSHREEPTPPPIDIAAIRERLRGLDAVTAVPETTATHVSSQDQEYGSGDVFLMMYELCHAMLGRPAVAGAIAAEVLHNAGPSATPIRALDETIHRALGVAARTIHSGRFDEVPDVEARRVIWRELALSSIERRRVIAFIHLLRLDLERAAEMLGMSAQTVEWVAADTITTDDLDIDGQILHALSLRPAVHGQSSCAAAADWLAQSDQER